MFLWHSSPCVQSSSYPSTCTTLSLDQSFLGMNITEFSTPFSMNYNMTNPNTPTATSSNSTNSSSASTSSSQGSPNPQLWNMTAFGILSGPLLFVTIILPVIMGPMTRWLFQSYIKLKRFWRLVYVLVGVASIVSYYIERNVYLPYVFDVPLVFIAVNRLVEAFLRKWRKRYWIFFSLVVTCCTLVDTLFLVYFPFGLCGWAILLWLQLRGYTFVGGFRKFVFWSRGNRQ